MSGPFHPPRGEDCPICSVEHYGGVDWLACFRICWDFGALMFWATVLFMGLSWLVRGHLPPCGW